jgi:aminoglycoside phosphotransferase (APT) family kinase protein
MTAATPTIHDAERLASDMLGRTPDRCEAYSPQHGGSDSHAYRLRAGSDDLLLKIMKHPGHPVGTYFHGRLREAGIPVPELVAFTPDSGPAGQACVIWEWVEGRTVNWQKREPCPFDEAEFAELLRRIHALEFDGLYGILGDDLSSRTFSWSPRIRPVCERWVDHFDFPAVAESVLSRGYIAAAEAEVLASLPERLDGALCDAPCRLLHTDLRNNVILAHGSRRILAVIDYTESCAGDPRWELAMIDFRFADRLNHYLPFDMQRFRDAYGTTHNPRDAVGRFYLAAMLAFDELPNCDPDSLAGQWQIATLRSVLDSFDGP